jgi:hypothetical protein
LRAANTEHSNLSTVNRKDGAEHVWASAKGILAHFDVDLAIFACEDTALWPLGQRF